MQSLNDCYFHALGSELERLVRYLRNCKWVQDGCGGLCRKLLRVFWCLLLVTVTQFSASAK